METILIDYMYTTHVMYIEREREKEEEEEEESLPKDSFLPCFFFLVLPLPCSRNLQINGLSSKSQLTRANKITMRYFLEKIIAWFSFYIYEHTYNMYVCIYSKVVFIDFHTSIISSLLFYADYGTCDETLICRWNIRSTYAC